MAESLNRLKIGLFDLTKKMIEFDEWADGGEAPIEVKNLMSMGGEAVGLNVVLLKTAELFAQYLDVDPNNLHLLKK